ncbi:MAG: FG-GAP repeat domain-containing protein [Planctomycetales bacterium]
MPKSPWVWILLGIVIALGAWFGLPRVSPLRTLAEPAATGGSRYPASLLTFERREIGPPPGVYPLIANVQILDFDGDGRNDILACDVRGQSVVVCRVNEQGVWSEETVADEIATPAHATLVDLDRDGDADLLISVLGDILPNDGVVGRLLWLEQTPQGFVRRVILDDVRRVADCQPGDLDGDGDIDLAVAVFGYARGQVLWMENQGNVSFEPHEILSAPGTIHVPVADFDGDGDLDIATGVSQDEEELWGLENLGGGQFQPQRLWYTINFDLGSAGLLADDLDGDGDMDLILPVGDNLEVTHSFPQRYHGCLWFENAGSWQFTPHRIGDLGGTYAAAIGDLDGDGDRDVVLVSMFNHWDEELNASVVWLENDGRQQFTTWQIDSRPTHRIAVAVGDLDGDGRSDILTGGMHLVGPFDRLGRLTAWFNRGTGGTR